MRIRGYRADRLVYLAPGIVISVGGGLGVLYGLLPVTAVLGLSGALMLAGGYLMRSTPTHTSPIDRVRGRVSMALRSWSLPFDRAGAADLHNVERILGDGSVEMTDGRIVTFARLDGRNTDFQTAEEAQTMVSSLRRGIDSAVEEIDFSIYSFSTSPDAAAITEKYKDVWLSDRYDRESSRDVIGYLKSILNFEPERSEIAKATEWEQYLVVQVAPDEIDAPEIESVAADAALMAQQVEADTRLTAVCEAFGSVTGVGAHPVSGPAHARVVAQHWAGIRSPSTFEGIADNPVSIAEGIESTTLGTPQAPDDDDLPPLDPSLWTRLGKRVRTVLRGVRSLLGGPDLQANPALWDDTRIKDLLSASYWDERPSDDMVVAGDQYARTYWIADWPTRPTPKFLKELHTLRGIDVSVHHRFTARETDAVKEELRGAAGEIDTSISERKEESNTLDAGILEDEMDAFVGLYKLVHHTDVQPWEIASYVTVRAGDRRAIEEAEALIERGYDEPEVAHDLAKRRALDAACDEVEDVLTSAGLTPVTDANRQGELFRSASPTGQDTYADTSTHSRTRLAGTGALAATFPPCSTSLQHEMGVELGRNPTTGRVISIDPFETPPAMRLTLGKTGSGKTWSTLKQVIRWYLSDPDERTLVLCDTKNHFAGATGLLNGNTITVGGTTTLNLLRMQPMDAESVEETGVDPFRQKLQFVLGVVLDLICETDDARDRFRPLLRDGIHTAMIEAGIDPDDPSTHTPENSPTMVDVRDAIAAIETNPSGHVTYDAEETEIEANAGALLRKLAGFEPGGEFGFLTGHTAPSDTIDPGEVTYLNLQQIEGLGATEAKTTLLSVALGEVFETVKAAPEKTLFVIDEAHYLLKSERLLSWLDGASRTLRHEDAGLWFVSQYPGDFVSDGDDTKQQHRSVIRDQAQITEIFKTEAEDALGEFGLNAEQIAFLREEASMGDNDATNYSDCLIEHPDVEGWQRACVTVSAAEYSIFRYKPDTHGSYRSYLDANWTRHEGDVIETDGGEH